MKFLIPLNLISTILGCQNNNQRNLQMLKNENDSLNSILKTLKTKYIFDSIAVRQIPYYGNTYELGSIVKGEVVYVGFNLDESTEVIIGDSIDFIKGNVFNADTLDLVKGGFKYEIKLSKERTTVYGLLNIDSKYGRNYESHYSTLIQAH